MAKGSNSAVPGTPMKTGGTDDYDTEMLVETPGTDEYTGRSFSFEEDAHESNEAMEEDYDLEEKEDIPEDAILAAGRSSELDEVVGPEPAFGDDDDDDDSKQAVTTSQVTEQKTGCRPPMNGDTPAANKVLGRTYEEMMEKSTWIRLFEPKRIRQAVWAGLSHELAVAVAATTTGQVASDTVHLWRSGIRENLVIAVPDTTCARTPTNEGGPPMIRDLVVSCSPCVPDGGRVTLSWVTRSL
ncbi:hypothetical protein PHMEG_00034506 [Phytophthora megakarya]|uniref:Eukaryotic/viral aspartic protease n=1 Tax=Phytophthora megakarya TaxID=4795 RepID=A0A225URA3_9STRA|nr:hypothetical protein PHMEG_00034506 [Phytophthora megakarya]